MDHAQRMAKLVQHVGLTLQVLCLGTAAVWVHVEPHGPLAGVVLGNAPDVAFGHVSEGKADVRRAAGTCLKKLESDAHGNGMIMLCDEIFDGVLLPRAAV